MLNILLMKLISMEIHNIAPPQRENLILCMNDLFGSCNTLGYMLLSSLLF